MMTKNIETTKRTGPWSQNFFSAIALVLVMVSEVLLWWFARNMMWRPFWRVATVAVLLLAMWWLVALIHGYKFKPKSEILTKLLANAVSPRALGVWYLLTFAIHIGWLADGIMYLYLHFTFELSIVFASIGICIVGLAVLIVFFPDGRIKKDENAKRVFVSGISLVNVPYDKVYKKLTLRPLVSVLRNITDSNCELLILLSDFGNPDKNKITDGINKVLEFISSAETVDKDMPVTEQLSVVIREVAKHEFPEKQELINGIKIYFTEPCNYNVFSQCFATLKPFIKKLDDKTHLLAFNMTPGTGIIGSLMTLMAIHADRDLYYYSQDDNVDDAQRLTLVDKTKVPLRSLLSQALENIKKDD